MRQEPSPSVEPKSNHRTKVENRGTDSRGHGEEEYGRRATEFTYLDQFGRPYLIVAKDVAANGKKNFPQYHIENVKRVKGPPPGPRIPYRLPQLIKASPDIPICFTEGEKDADTLAKHGFTATTNPEGAGKFQAELVPWFAGRKTIYLFEDNDHAGRLHVAKTAARLDGVVKNIFVVRFPDVPEKEDVTYWLDALGHTKSDLLERIQAAPKADTKAGILEILPKAEFLRGFIPPDYLIDGILQRRFIYSLTGQTGHAKTAIALRLAKLVDSGGALDGHEVARGRVAYLVGENPDDVRMRVIADDATLGHSGNGNIIFVPGTFDTDALLQQIESRGHLDFIIIDTSAAYFLGDDENDNPAMGDHARKLRRLIGLPGGPCELVLCHPIKHAVKPAQLLPRGGGAFLAEIDGNLTAWKDDRLITLHHSDKFRGPGFEPITFRLDKVAVEALKDSKDRMIPTVRAVAISEAEEEQEAESSRRDEDLVLAARYEAGRSMSIADLASALGWTFADGRPYKSKVQRALNRLKAAGLMKSVRGKWELTPKGEKTVQELGPKDDTTS